LYLRSPARQMLFEGPPRSVLGIGLRARGARRRSFDRAPVVENERNVADARGATACDHSQVEIVILAAFEALAKSAHLTHARGAQRRDVRQVVLRQEEVGVPVRLEERVVESALLIDLV